MKILYVISVAGHGKGGHFHSLYTIAEAMKGSVEAHIVSIGPGRSHLIESSSVFYKHLSFNSIPGVGLYYDFQMLLKEINPDVVHCFDERAYLLTSLYFFISRQNLPIVLTKCGGPNSADYPVASTIIMFSNENLAFYQKNPKYAGSSIHLIPNRVRRNTLRKQHAIFEALKNNFLVFKIARISEFYRQSLSDAIQLTRKLEERGCSNIRLCIVGTIENRNVLASLEQEAAGLPVEFITNAEITHKAADFLHYANMAVCTGRGFMEATALGIPVLAKVKQSHMPMLVDQQNFNTFFYYNFSERTNLPEADDTENLNRIEQIISDPAIHAKYSALSDELFRNYFDVEGAVSQYMDVYKESGKKPVKLFVLQNVRAISKMFLFFYRNKQKTPAK